MGRRNIFRDKGVTKEYLEDLYLRQNRTDSEIGALIGVSDVSVSYFRKKFGIPSKSQVARNTFGSSHPSFEAITPMELSNLHSSMCLRSIARLYGVSKPTVALKCKKFGITPLSKSERATSHDALTEDQKESIIGSLLGDGHLLERGVFKVSHYQEQIEYLRVLHKALAPHVLPIYYEEKELDSGRLAFAFGFQTVQHEWLKLIRSVFYPNGSKVFPPSVLQSLSPRSLAFWYFDDGHLDGGLPSFALGDITESEALEVIRLVGERFSIGLYRGTSSSEGSCELMCVRGSSASRFFELILEFAPRDMLYKFPARHWPKGLTPKVPVRTEDKTILPSGLVGEGKRWPNLSEEERSTLVEAFANFWESHGFPYHTPRPEDLNSLLNLNQHHVIQDGVIKARQVGQCICQGICKHIWEGKSYNCQSPLELFSNPTKLRELIRFCLTSGSIPNATKLRGALRFWKRSGVYNFRPSAAKALVDRYCPSGGVVLDPCAGYGGRLLGTILSSSTPTYVGVEPSTETNNALHALYRWVSSYLPEVSNRVSLMCTTAEEAEFPQQVDLVLTSPPYWKREVYSEEETQSSARYQSYTSWLNGFWSLVIEKSIQALRPGGWIVLNVDDFSLGGRDYPLIDDTVRICSNLGLGSPERFEYALPGSASGSTLNSEVVLCWAKGSGPPQPTRETSLGANSQKIPSISRCSTCGKVSPYDTLVGGICHTCAKPTGHSIRCEGCGVTFLASRLSRRFCSDACYSRHKRKLKREASPLTGIRKFTCSECLAIWETKELGSFKLCPTCRARKEAQNREKTCSYRGCATKFTDTSPKNSMSYCCPEHRRREKLFRSGIAKDVSYFRDISIKYQPRCIQCHNKWQPDEDEKKNNKCPSCRELRRVKACHRCGAKYKDTSVNNTRRYCFSCKP